MTAYSQPSYAMKKDLYSGFLNPDPSARPMMRWWWFGPDMDAEDITRDLDDIAAAGLGGVECSFVYPMSVETDQFMSSKFLADVSFAAKAARERGLRFDITLGSGWPFGGPHIDHSTASRQIHWEEQELSLGALRLAVPGVWPGDEFIAAYIREGTRQETGEFSQLTEEVGPDGVTSVVIPEGRGPRTVLLAISRLSGQTLKRAAAGAEGFVLDHLSAAAAQQHIREVAEPLVQAAGVENITTVFCDSLEVYDSGWSSMVPEEFARRRGYEALPQLWKLRVTSGEYSQFHADYFRTLTEMVEENFIAVFDEFARSKGLTFRLQCYGQPPVTVSSYRHAGAFEGEGWGWDALTACRWASSAAQLYNKPIVSSEVWTWNHSPSFRSTPLDLLGEAHDHILMGINHFIGHGWPASPRPSDPKHVGRVFYAAGALDSRNAWWGVAPALWKTLHRLAWIMRQGRRLADVAVYIPARDISANFMTAGRMDLYKESRLHVTDELIHGLRVAGLDFDAIDDDAMISPESLLTAQTYPLVVLPYAHDLPGETRQWLKSVEESGGVVVDLGGQAGVGISVDSVSDVISHARPRMRVSTSEEESSVAVTTREITADDVTSSTGMVRVHFVANTGDNTQNVSLDFSPITSDTSASVVPDGTDVLECWDAETGVVLSRHRGTAIELNLEPYEAVVVVQYQALPAEPVPLLDSSAEGSSELKLADHVAVLSEWTVQFPDAQPERVRLPHRWESQPGREVYSGSAIYETSFVVPSGADRVVLDLGPAVAKNIADPAAAGLVEASFNAAVTTPVGVVAQVEVDGVGCGSLWKTPYRLELPAGLAPDVAHQLRLVVSNVTSHRLAVDTQLLELVDQVHGKFGPRFGIQTLELALADVDSGLFVEPQLRFFKQEGAS